MNRNKSKDDKNVLFVYAICNVLLAICIFLFGFFPINSFNNENISASMDDLPTSINQTSLNPNVLYKPLVQKVVIMVIDALRWDFVSTLSDGSNKTMFITNNLLDKNFGRLFQVKVNNPTVTMPRIKAMTTGTVSNYIDVILNLGETRVSSDNILLQAKKHGHKLIFYGDDTWLQMFNDVFHRFEGTSSFFVNDFVEVDNNVTRNIYSELKKNSNWSIMILHYLGLDHIGHVYGPKSPFIKSKLKEMDKIIEDISTQIIQWNKQDIKSLFIICGDHGMKNSGGHGGATPEETLVPLVAIGGTYDYNNSNNESVNQIDQIDITATLAVMLGIPLPSTNIGVVSLSMINYNLSSAHKLYILYYNGKQIFNHFKKLSNFHSKECYFDYLKAIKLHEEWISSSNNENNSDDTVEEIINLYLKSLKEMKNLLVQSMIYYNIPLMSIAIILIAQVFIIIINLKEEENETFSLKKYIHSWIFGVVAWFLLNYLLVNVTDDNDKSSNVTDLPVAFIFTIFILFNFNTYLLSTRTFLSSHLARFWTNVNFNNSNTVLSLAIALHVLSFGSSSFIEEEHQTWYFYWSTFLAIILVYCIKQKSSKIIKENGKNLIANATGKILFLLMLQRLLRKLNSTGNKYANLPDISGWLKASDYSNFFMTFILSIGLGSILFILTFIVGNDKNKRLQQKDKLLFYSSTLLCIYLRHASEENVYRLPFYPKSRGIHEVKIFWIICTFYLIHSIKKIICCHTKTDKCLINQLIYLSLQYWIIISAMLHRPYNIILLPTHLITQIIISDFFKNYTNKTSILTFISYCIGNVFYFYQGNSNSLATIDVAASCIGLETYMINVAALFVCINTFSSPVLAYLMLIFQSTSETTLNTNEFYQKLYSINRRYAIFKLFPLVIYTIIVSIERHHLFVWSVFAPKLLYEATHCALIFSIICIIEITTITLKKIYKV